MDFFFIANAWSAGKDNPTSKHRIALELLNRGHRVLWIEGAGMRTPSMGSSHDRLRMARKVLASLRGARRETTDRWAVRNDNESQADSPKSNASAALWVLSPLFIPLPKFEFVRRINGLICRANMKLWGWKLGFRDPVLINYVPVLAEAMRGWRRRAPGKQLLGCQVAGLSSDRPTVSSIPATGQLNSLTTTPCAPRVVYHCVDRWDAFSTYDSRMMSEMDRRCCVYADLVIASAGELFDRCKTLNPNTVLIPHGVDWEHFRRGVAEAGIESAPSPLAGEGWGEGTVADKQAAGETRKPVVGFFGLLSEWVDQDLILKLARAFAGPAAHSAGVGIGPVRADIVLIGKADVDVSRLQGIPNIHLLGPRPFADLPRHIAGFSVGIIPFVVNDLTRSVNPIKLREMLAAGCPVVSTALPEVERCAREIGVEGYVVAAADHESFVSAVAARLAAPLSQGERRRISDRARVESWAGKVDRMMELMGAG